ncbi:MAG: ABC transporter permease [Spirochaetota bacterium]
MKRQFLRAVAVIIIKNIRIYYNKAPVLIFGLLFPFFIFLSFYMGKKLNLSSFFPGLLAMTLFFTSSSVGPLITPWEKQSGTYERLLCFPVNIVTIIMGDVIAGMIFGIIISAALLIFGLLFFTYNVHAITLSVAIVLSAFCFSSLGVLIASYPGQAPSNVMMISAVIRFPLIFISGIFIPLQSLKGMGKYVTFVSPITYLVDILNHSLVNEHSILPVISFTLIAIFSLIFIFLAFLSHRRTSIKFF